MAKTLAVPAWFYQHGDADFSLDVPEEAFGGWKKAPLDLSLDHTAVVVMHAWDAGASPDQFPGWWRVVPYIVRANAIMETVFPPLLEAVRQSPMPLFHVVAGGDYYTHLPGYERAVELAPRKESSVEKISPDPALQAMLDYKHQHGYPRPYNVPDIERGFARIDFGPQAHPRGDEGVAENGPQLYGLCRAHNITHLIYMGFAINWCLLLSPGGMAEIGMAARQLTFLKQVSLAPGFMNARMGIFLAEDLFPQQLTGDEPEPLEVIPWPLKDAEALLEHPQFHEARSVAALLLLLRQVKDGVLSDHPA